MHCGCLTSFENNGAQLYFQPCSWNCTILFKVLFFQGLLSFLVVVLKVGNWKEPLAIKGKRKESEGGRGWWREGWEYTFLSLLMQWVCWRCHIGSGKRKYVYWQIKWSLLEWKDVWYFHWAQSKNEGLILVMVVG